EGVYLRSFLEPFAAWLERDDINEIIVNRPGEVWIEKAGAAQMLRVEAPAITDQLLARLAAQIARVAAQGVNREHPLLAAVLPNGSRVQMAGPPATRRHWALAIRRHLSIDLDLEAYDLGPIEARANSRSAADETAAARRNPTGFLRTAVQERRTILI